MSKAKLPPESEVVSWLKQIIENEELLESITGQEVITSLTDTVIQEHFLPCFGIDYISRRASAEAADFVLSRLSLLEIISINTSISLTTGEVLRPGILCFNPETKTLVVFEVSERAKPSVKLSLSLQGTNRSFETCFRS